ncbi:putative methyltransferase PMT27 [Wolffia australiana]
MLDIVRREEISLNDGLRRQEQDKKSEEVEEKEEPPAAEDKTQKQPELSLDHETFHSKEHNRDHESEESVIEEDGYKMDYSKWDLCKVTAGPDYIPCLDNSEALRHISTRHYEHRERHCPSEPPLCLVPLPKGYKRPLQWPRSRDKIWYKNVPHTKLAKVKGHQNWVKVSGEYLLFPGGGTQFIHGALHYIDFIQRSVRDIGWGRRTRVVLDVGCGVASFGGYLFERDVLTMSFAPKDEHEAQVQFALERGIPAISAVMGSQRLPFPSNVFDLVHCARCRVPWHAEGGTLLLELNRVLRPGGFFIWSATPVYQKLKEDVDIWKAMTALTKAICWELVAIRKDRLNSVAAAFFRKPVSNECYDNREDSAPSLCRKDDDPDLAWYISLQNCIPKLPTESSARGIIWPELWPGRLSSPPHWLNSSELDVYGKPTAEEFVADQERWKTIFSTSYRFGVGVDWTKVRNVMDMRAVYGGFAAALKDLKVWVMNVVDVESPETLPIIFDRGLFGIYHDWCESFSTYPRTYDLLHADKLFSRLNGRCNLTPVVVEIDRIVRPGGKLIVRDEMKVVKRVEDLLKSLRWEIRSTYSEDQEEILCAEKSEWRPENPLSVSS